jgi:hypothetical protein
MVGPDRPQIQKINMGQVLCMLKIKGTVTHSEYVTVTVYPRQK